LTDPKGDISFQNIVFNYPNRPDAPILNGLDLEIPSGMIYALVGHSGSGKSTLGHLLLRLYDPQSGQVCLDKTDLKMYDPIWLHGHIGVVSQVSYNDFSESLRTTINIFYILYLLIIVIYRSQFYFLALLEKI
jgi:ABC-type multidrug transport system fused ATPase/permease subunit